VQPPTFVIDVFEETGVRIKLWCSLSVSHTVWDGIWEMYSHCLHCIFPGWHCATMLLGFWSMVWPSTGMGYSTTWCISSVCPRQPWKGTLAPLLEWAGELCCRTLPQCDTGSQVGFVWESL
jgi:hypothetical protein